MEQLAASAAPFKVTEVETLSKHAEGPEGPEGSVRLYVSLSGKHATSTDHIL